MPKYQYPRQTSRIERKLLVRNEPKLDDVSQYTFPEGTNPNTFSYEDSTSLPKNNGKFENKDLNITCVGDELNEKIIDRNLNHEMNSGIRIDKLYISYTGHKTLLKNVWVKMWMFSEKWLNDQTSGGVDSYDNLVVLMNIESTVDRVFYYPSGDLGAGEDLGNLTFIEGVDIISNLNETIDDVNVGEHTATGLNDSTNEPDEYSPSTMLTKNETGGQTSVFDEETQNGIYIVIQVHADGTNPSDDRDSKWQVFKMNNLEFFDDSGNPKTTVFTFPDMFIGQYASNESGGYVDEPALEVTEFQVSVNTRAQENDWDLNQTSADEKEYRDYFELVQPILPFNNTFHISNSDETTFLQISPKRQLDNFEDVGDDLNNDFPNFFPKQHIGILNLITNDLEPELYLDEYRDDMDERLQSIGSAPALVSFDLEMVNSTYDATPDGQLITDTTNYMIPSVGSNNDTDLAKSFYYFVINWDDKDNEIKSLDDWLEIRPTKYKDIRALQNNNLYKVVKQTQSQTTSQKTIEFSERLSNKYTTPGIKTIKTIIFSYNDDNNQIGRWKLLTSRFYLDIPSEQYSEFTELGGSDFTTIPWPYPTPVIGGVDENSKYKISVREAISGGKIGDTDIIDEKLLINDRDNDELGKSILSFDFEQVRYFNKPYGINSLLNLVYSDGLVGENIYLTSEEHLVTLPGYAGGGVIDGDPHMTINELSWTPVGQSNPAFGEDGYLLSIYTYDELKELWELQQSRINAGLESTILKAMNDFVYYNLDTSNWIYNEEDLNTFIYEGFISAETGLFVNDMAVAIYRLEVGLFPAIPDYEINANDINQWNAIGRPDIATFLTSVLSGEAQPNPPIIDEDGNQTFGGGPNEGGPIEGGVEGEDIGEPHFQGGVPIPGGGGQIGGDSSFPPALPQLNLISPATTMEFSTGDVITIEWEQMEDTTLHAVSPGDYGAPGTTNAFYYSQGKFPASWNFVNIELVSQNQGGFPDIIVGNIGPNDGEDLDAQYPGAHRAFHFTAPSAEELGFQYDADEVRAENYKVRLTVNIGGDVITDIAPMSFKIFIKMAGGDAPPVGTRPKKYFENTTFVTLETTLPHRYNKVNQNGTPFWDGVQNKFPKESSVGQIFINDIDNNYLHNNQNNDLLKSCQLEFNAGELTGKSIYDSSGTGKKGLLIGDYKVKKSRKGDPMRRDSFIKVPKKASNETGAL